MSGLVTGSYWCCECRRAVNPAMDVELKCPYCDGGSVEEMSSRVDLDSVPALVSDRSLSPWAPILLSMVGSASSEHSWPRRGDEGRGEEEEEEEDNSDLNHEFPELLRIRHRTADVLRLLQSLRDDIRQAPQGFQREREREAERLSNRENLFLMDPSSRALVAHESSGNDRQLYSSNIAGGMPPRDFLVGHGLDILLQHLTEIGSSHRGTPPARRDAVDALPTVKIQELTGCSVCLDDFVVDAEAKELPCKHKFHGDCILPWLELHSSCPVCRSQLPTAADSKISSDSGNVNRTESISGSEDRDRIPFLWPSVRYEF